MNRTCFAICVGLVAGSWSLRSTSSAPLLTTIPSSTVQQDADSLQRFARTVQLPPSRAQQVRCDNEAKCLADLHDVASRKGDVLILRLDNGVTKTFRSNPKACYGDNTEKCNVTTLIGYMSPQHMFVLRGSVYELTRYGLVGGRNGQVVGLEGEPHLSPDGKRFVVVAVADEMNGWERDVAIFSESSFPPRLEWSYKTEAPPDVYAIYSFVGWDGNDRISLRVTSGGREVETDVTLTAEGWKIRLPTGEYRAGTSPVR
jgi:hypothetical protein